VFLLAGAFAPHAFAATVSITGSTLVFTAAPGETNNVSIVWTDVQDSGSNLTAGAGCTAVDAHSVSCPGPFTSATIDLGDGNDTAGIYVGVQSTINAGSGNDNVSAHLAPAVIHGEGGDDQLGGFYTGDVVDGGDGADTLEGSPFGTLAGGPGDDSLSGYQQAFIDGGGGADTLGCFPTGVCTLDYSARTNPVFVTEDGVADDGEAGEHDNVLEGIGDMLGGSGGDHLTSASVLFTSTVKGNGGNDVLVLTGQGRLEGGPGNDNLTGSIYNDQLDGGTGADFMDGGDGVDLVDYGSRTNAVVLNLGDALANDGEAGENDKLLAFEYVLTGSGNDTVNGGTVGEHIDAGAGADTLNGGGGDDFFVHGPGADVMNGGAGTADTASYAGAMAVTVTIDGIADDGTPGENDDVGLDVENLEGSDGNDTLTGSPSANRIDGSFGDDHLDGAAGDDELLGGPGLDALAGGPGDDVLTDLDDTPNILTGSEGNDVLSGRGALDGGDGNDTLTGDSSDDVLTGGAGDDTLLGKEGADRLDGGGGADLMNGGDQTDWADYSSHASDVHVDMDSQVGDDGSPGEGDTVKNVENLLGGDGNDVLVGNAEQNTLEGGLGDDVIKPGAGFDVVTYEDHVTPVHADLDGVSGDDGSAGEHDTLGGDIEWLVGGQGSDVLAGNGANNTLSGGKGDEVLRGLGGQDILNGDEGNDALDGGNDSAGDAFRGGAGTDTADFSAWKRRVTISISSDPNPFPGGRDKLAADMENIIGGAANDRLVGNDADNVLRGGGGSDVLDGKSGADVLDGQGGVGDRVDYSSRAAAVTVDLDGEVGDDGEPGEGDTVSATTEDVFGGLGGDTLTGNNSDNTLRGGPGGDILTGGPGTDLADYSDHTAGVTVDLTDTTADQGAAGEGDTLAEMENILSGKGSDVLSGNDARNWIDGGAGADAISGRGGFDTLDYSSHRDRVVVVVDGQANDGSRNEHDDVGVDIEHIIGTRGDDVILTGTGRQVLDGRGGDDILDGWFGSDVYKGGNGFDYVAYFGRTKPVHADLDGHADDGERGENDVLSRDVESLAGGNGNDVLIGNGRINGLAGGRGNDAITGGAGSDGLFGDAGSDQLFARDGRRDYVVGGKGSDHASIDAGLDVVRSVESLARSIAVREPAWSGRPGTWSDRLQFIGARLHDQFGRLVPRAQSRAAWASKR
jgi:Ca2+-binding RTX toxin-like protein